MQAVFCHAENCDAHREGGFVTIAMCKKPVMCLKLSRKWNQIFERHIVSRSLLLWRHSFRLGTLENTLWSLTTVSKKKKKKIYNSASSHLEMSWNELVVRGAPGYQTMEWKGQELLRMFSKTATVLFSITAFSNLARSLKMLLVFLTSLLRRLPRCCTSPLPTQFWRRTDSSFLVRYSVSQ